MGVNHGKSDVMISLMAVIQNQGNVKQTLIKGYEIKD